MIFFAIDEILWMLLLAVLVDLLIGDPSTIPHPVLIIGKLISSLENILRQGRRRENAVMLRLKGVCLTVVTVLLSFAVMLLLILILKAIHPWLAYAANIWFIASTIALKGLKEAAMQVYQPLAAGNLAEARLQVSRIVGRDTDQLDEEGITRAAVETVAENTVDAVISPLFYALLGGAPLAMVYRATNTLDSMVGYKNERYLWFGWASARWDDVMNLIPARIGALLLALAAGLTSGWASLVRSLRSVVRFARLHPSPNSGYPEAAVAGALGVELGGLNRYSGVISQRAAMGWPLRRLDSNDIVRTVRLLYLVGYMIAGCCVCGIVLLLL